MGVTCETGNAHSSGTPDFTLQWGIHVCSFFIYRFCQCPDKHLIGQRFWFCLLWYILILMQNVYLVDLPFSEPRNVVSYELLLLICIYEVFGRTFNLVAQMATLGNFFYWHRYYTGVSSLKKSYIFIPLMFIYGMHVIYCFFAVSENIYRVILP